VNLLCKATWPRLRMIRSSVHGSALLAPSVVPT
jgi:hypothetical protein